MDEATRTTSRDCSTRIAVVTQHSLNLNHVEAPTLRRSTLHALVVLDGAIGHRPHA